MSQKCALSPKPDLRVLGIDVCTGFCSVAIVDGQHLRAMKHEAMTRGHAERLAPMVSEVFQEVGLIATDLDGIAVTTGPGSFTGARLGVSFARGLALATGIPAVGVTVFEAMSYGFNGDQVAVALRGKNGTVLLQTFEGKAAITDPMELSAETAWQILPKSGMIKGIGSDVDTLLTNAPSEITERCSIMQCEPVTSETIARIGTTHLNGTFEPPTPLYLRAPDAKLQPQIILNG